MKLGMSGSQDGITNRQQFWLNKTMRGLGMTEFHHGACIGADAYAHLIALDYFDGYVTEPDGLKVKPIIVHPASDVAEHKVDQKSVEPHPLVLVLPAKPALKRNRDIVAPLDRLLATPSGYERLRSGTWATVRYAVRCQVPVSICYPSGETEQR
jgi:hypothetical protein